MTGSGAAASKSSLMMANLNQSATLLGSKLTLDTEAAAALLLSATTTTLQSSLGLSVELSQVAKNSLAMLTCILMASRRATSEGPTMPHAQLTQRSVFLATKTRSDISLVRTDSTLSTFAVPTSNSVITTMTTTQLGNEGLAMTTSTTMALSRLASQCSFLPFAKISNNVFLVPTEILLCRMNRTTTLRASLMNSSTCTIASLAHTLLIVALTATKMSNQILAMKTSSNTALLRLARTGDSVPAAEASEDILLMKSKCTLQLNDSTTTMLLATADSINLMHVTANDGRHTNVLLAMQRFARNTFDVSSKFQTA